MSVQLVVRSGTGQHQLQLIALDAVDEQPVSLDVDLRISFPVVDQCMIAIFGALLLFLWVVVRG